MKKVVVLMVMGLMIFNIGCKKKGPSATKKTGDPQAEATAPTTTESGKVLLITGLANESIDRSELRPSISFVTYVVLEKKDGVRIVLIGDDELLKKMRKSNNGFATIRAKATTVFKQLLNDQYEVYELVKIVKIL